jgi:hypothetical protein
MTNMIPLDHILLLKGFSSQASQNDIQAFGMQTTPNLIRVMTKKDESPCVPGYDRMAFFMYASPRWATVAKTVLSKAINIPRTEANTLDLSRVFVVDPATAHRSCERWFTLWVGNVHDATFDSIRMAFGKIFAGRQVSMHVTIRSSSNCQRYAFVNFETYDDADEALRRFNDEDIVCGSFSSVAAIVQPHGRLLFVRRLLLILQDHPDHLVSLADAEDIAKRILVAGRSGLPDWLELLRSLPHHFTVDDAAGAIKLTRRNEQPAAAPVQGVRPAGSVTLTPPDLPGESDPGDDSAGTDSASEVGGGAIGCRSPAWECGVCLKAAGDNGGAAGKAALVPCGHTFCSRCCSRVFAMPARKCPACRMRISSVLPLFGV